MAETEGIDREADLNRSASRLARHTAATVFDMADECGAKGQTVASMLSSMAETHRRAAALLDAAALKAVLQIKDARQHLETVAP